MKLPGFTNVRVGFDDTPHHVPEPFASRLVRGLQVIFLKAGKPMAPSVTEALILRSDYLSQRRRARGAADVPELAAFNADVDAEEEATMISVRWDVVRQ